MNRILLSLCLLLGMYCYAATPVVAPDYSVKSLIGPGFFGPNAFPIPPMLTGQTDSLLVISLGADEQLAKPSDVQIGNMGEQTTTIQAYLSIPLFTPRVNLRIWMPVMEFYQNTNFGKGHGAGDVYISTDIQIVKERQYIPGIVLRAAMKTASGDEYEKYRFYDSPGYFFDLGIGKGWTFDNGMNMRVAGSAGFLCWQTDNGRQNDAVMYGIYAKLGYKYIAASATYSGYVGWENIGDRPMSIRCQIMGNIKKFEPFLAYDYGIKDYPFHTISLGLRYGINILTIRKK